VKHNSAAFLREVLFKHVENCRRAPHAVHRENLVSGFRASFENAAEHVLLRIHGFVKARTGVEADFADIACLRQKALPQWQLRGALCHELRMQAERSPHIVGVARELRSIASWNERIWIPSDWRVSSARAVRSSTV
jgi:hypothetical protein